MNFNSFLSFLYFQIFNEYALLLKTEKTNFFLEKKYFTHVPLSSQEDTSLLNILSPSQIKKENLGMALI